ncbi:MAG: hypothetical protein LH609_11305 [Rudanella sp.]|nr:hypothetical protein [Rudanella sp.]
MLSQTLLRHLANASSYSKGESLFSNGYVRRIKRTGNTFTGKVEGSELYELSLSLDTEPPQLLCDCPYNYDGICKHAVAFGMAVLDQFGPKIELVPTSTTAQTVPVVDLDTLWQRTTTEEKLNFLRQLLTKQPDLQTQLALFTAPELVVPTAQPAGSSASRTESVETISTTVYEALSDLSFDEQELDDYDHYSEESPDPTPQIEGVLTGYANQAILALREGRLPDAFTVCLGVYEGTHAASEAQNDDYGAIDDYPAQSWQVWNELLTESYTQLASRVLNSDLIGKALDLMAARVQHFEADRPEQEEEADDDEQEFYYYLREFDPLLLALVTDNPSAKAVQQAIEKHKWQQFGTEYVQLRIADVLNDPDLWFRTADQFADHGTTIGLQLLERRHLLNKPPVLLQTLHRLTKSAPGKYDAFILSNLDDKALTGDDLKLLLNALETRCRQTGQLADYMRLRDYWREGQRRDFANSLLPNSTAGYMSQPLLYAQILDTEARTADLWDWFKTFNWNASHSLPDILALVARSYPNECVALARERTFNELVNGKRDRRLYGTIAGWLAGLNTLPGLRTSVMLLAGQLVAQHSTLRALKDELKMKGVLR